MSIQWYPGHMNAARKKAAEQMENTDLVIEVLDARLPEASCNPMVEELRLFRQRPCLKILNKVDLADPVATAAWSAWYDAQEGVTAYPMTTKKPADVARIPELCLSLAPHRGVADPAQQGAAGHRRVFSHLDLPSSPAINAMNVIKMLFNEQPPWPRPG